MKKILFLFVFIFVSLVPSTMPVLAQTAGQSAECDELKKKFENAGAASLPNSLPVYCTEGSIFNKITTVLYTLVGAVAVIAIIYGGYVYTTARDNEDARKKGRQIITYTIIGIIIILLATLIVTIVSKFIVDNTLF